ncbi:bifunctional tetrahydrofolate synthase/dihydrofolate synthase [Halopseudomonas sabulinigri]|uniref:Dihydrofolate synthase/folylpolyglutamate synthase n=1 Tax=Halopseudomonas sabulinigri TaxID=472181 RepID=A0ABP9ZKY5_9GAMM
MSQRSLAQWLTRLEGLHPSEIDMGLARVRQVAERLELLQPAPIVFTVTGTNGKGSTCAALDSLLRVAGQQTGCYTSPHLLHYNERVRINGQMVSDEALCEAFAAVDQARGDVTLTYFEFGTLAALWLFKAARLDAVVLEVGLGGRLDAVNVVDADVAIVTSIGLDHQEYLGNTLESVGFEKAGILRSRRPVISGEQHLPSSFKQKVAELDCELLVRGVDFGWQPEGEDGWCAFARVDGQACDYHDLPPVSLPRDNLAVALQAFLQAGFRLPEPKVRQALAAATAPGRLEVRRVSWRGQPRQVCLDVGHNPHAATFMANALAASKRERVAVFGLLADKDLAGVHLPLQGMFSRWYVAPLDSPRSRPAAELAEHLSERGEQVKACSSIAEALRCALDETASETEIVIFGSFFCVAAAILWLSETSGELIDG